MRCLDRFAAKGPPPVSLDILHLDAPPEPADWIELSSYNPAPDGFLWAELLNEQDIDASHRYTDDVRRMLHTVPGASARLQELGELLLISTVRDAMRLAVCVHRLEELGELRRTGDGTTFTTARG